MAFNTQDAAAIAAGGGIGLGVSKLFGKKKTPNLDTAPLNQNVNDQFSQTQEQIGRITPGTEKNLGLYNTGVDTAQNTLTDSIMKANQGYRSAFDPYNSALVQNRTDQLKRDTADAQTGAITAAREAGAAGSGFGSGATRAALASIPLNFGANVVKGSADIQNTALNNALGAEKDIYGNNTGLANTLYGTDVSQQDTGLGARTNALNSEVSGLTGAIGDKYSSLNNIEQARQGFGIQNDINANNSRDALLGNLIQLGGTAAGAVVGGPAGAQVGSTLGSTLAKRRAAQSNSAVAGQGA